MRHLLACLVLVLAVPPTATAAQSPRYPSGLVARGVALNAACRAAGGQALNGPRPFVVMQHDLTGDRRADFILDEGAFGCSSRAFRPGSPAGAPIEVFDGATGASHYRGVAASWQVLAGARPQVLLTLRGSVCDPNALATTTCQRPLVWNAQTRTLAGPQGPLNRADAAQDAARPQKPPPTGSGSTGGLALSDADRAAVLKAAGFKPSRGVWRRCEEETPTASYQQGAVEEVLDLNSDGRPEAVITESSLICYGQQGAWFAILSREANGAWRQVLEADGVFVALPSKAHGWREVMVSGPGFTHPAYRYNGQSYVRHRMVKE